MLVCCCDCGGTGEHVVGGEIVTCPVCRGLCRVREEAVPEYVRANRATDVDGGDWRLWEPSHESVQAKMRANARGVAMGGPR